MGERIALDDGVRLHVEVEGPAGAPALMFCNPLGASLEVWDFQAHALKDRFRILRYDARGHGRSDAPGGEYPLDRLGRDALGVLDACGVARAHLCGLSLGAMTALWMAASAPERTDRLVLANAAARSGAPEGWEARRRAVLEDGVAVIADEVMQRWFTPLFRAQSPAAVERVREMLFETPARGYAGACAAMRDLDLTSLLGKVAAPTLVIGGRLDRSTPMAWGEEVAASIAGAKVVRLEGGHLSNVEQAQAFTDALSGFVA